MKTEPLWLGIDLGGTGTRFVLVNSACEIIDSRSLITDKFSASNLAESIEKFAQEIREFIVGADAVVGIGIGASGPVDLKTGQLNNPDTLPMFAGAFLADNLAKILGIPVWIDNDAVSSGIAEVHIGATTKDFRSVLCLTLGTGIGTALIVDQQPVRGGDGQHFEGGHIPVPGGKNCYCGLSACWEPIASRAALDSIRKEISDPDLLWEEYAKRLASGLLTHIVIFRPEAIVFNGSVSRYYADFKGPLLKLISLHSNYLSVKWIGASTLGDFAGARGAAILAMRGLGWSAPGR